MTIPASRFRNGLLLYRLSRPLNLVPEAQEFLHTTHDGRVRLTVSDLQGHYYLGYCAIGQSFGDVWWTPTFAIWSSPEVIANYPLAADEDGRLQWKGLAHAT